jgi:glycosyltransferase involved in cell wall biosynthesis
MIPDGQPGIRIALTEQHGVAMEYSRFPPDGIEYEFIRPLPSTYRAIRSPIKGYLGRYATKEHHLIEAVMSPILTKNKWIYYLENMEAAAAFSLIGCPLPKAIRIAFIKRLVLKDNCKKLIFWSNAGKETLRTYGKINDTRTLRKVAVVYPGIREVSDDHVRFNSNDNINLLFSGDFFRKGGVNVIDTFERAQRIFPNIRLRLCCDEQLDFNTKNISLRNEYLNKIKRNAGIIPGRTPRSDIINNILPKTDIYLLPTYVEAFGYAILEAMAYGIPVIATNHFAIPEMVEHNRSGFLIDTSGYDCDRLFRGYVVKDVPRDFREHVTDELFKYMCRLIESPNLRETFGRAGLDTARTKFSFRERNMKMSRIYREALA